MASTPNPPVLIFYADYPEPWVRAAASAFDGFNRTLADTGPVFYSERAVSEAAEAIRKAPAHERKPSHKLTPLERAQQGRYAVYQPARRGGKSRNK